MRIRIKDAELYMTLRAKCPYPYFEFRRQYSRYSGYRSTTLILGKLVIIMDWTCYTRTIQLCGYCDEPISRIGEDALDWCESCQCVEGNTYSELEYIYESK